MLVRVLNERGRIEVERISSGKALDFCLCLAEHHFLFSHFISGGIS